jgi:hypothetical protein
VSAQEVGLGGAPLADLHAGHFYLKVNRQASGSAIPPLPRERVKDGAPPRVAGVGEGIDSSVPTAPLRVDDGAPGLASPGAAAPGLASRSGMRDR